MIEAMPPAWDPERDEWLVCAAVRRETHDVSTFVFAPLERRLFRFLPGQFMTLALDAAGLERCYTIASPPTRPWRVEITTKRSGAGSGWLHTTMRPGGRMRASGPMGEFTFGPEPRGKYLFLSAGSGITPLMSMSRTVHDLGGDADIVFVHSARSPADLVFADELAAMARRPGFRPTSIVEADAPGMRWDGLRGRLSPAMLSLLAPDLAGREVFCCGPAPYMAAVRAMLDAAGFDRRRYHEESFDFSGDAGAEPPEPELQPGPLPTASPPTLTAARPALLAPVQAAPVDAVAQNAFSVTLSRSGRSIVCPPGSTILAAARAAGVRIPSACAKGVCGTCKSRLVSGTVALRHGGGIRQREIDQGLTLPCCARPTSDVVLER